MREKTQIMVAQGFLGHAAGLEEGPQVLIAGLCASSLIARSGRPSVLARDLSSACHLAFDRIPWATMQQLGIISEYPASQDDAVLITEQWIHDTLPHDVAATITAAAMGYTPRISNRRSGRDLVGDECLRFDRFWAAFSLKRARADAINAWAKLEDMEARRPGTVPFAAIIRAAGIEAALRPHRPKGAVPKMAQGWLNSARWEDDIYAHEPDAWTPEQASLLDLVHQHPIFERWTLVSQSRKQALDAALLRHPEIQWWEHYLRLSAARCRWDGLFDEGGKVPVATVINENVVVRHREFLQGLRDRARAQIQPMNDAVAPEDGELQRQSAGS